MPYDTTKPPDADAIQREAAYWERVWESARASIEKAYAFYFQKNDIWESLTQLTGMKDLGRPDYHSPKAPAIIDNAVDSAIPMHPRFHRMPVGDSDEAQESADRVEKGLLAVFAHAMAQNTNYATKVNGKQLAICNYTSLYTGLDADAMRKPVRKRGEDKEDFQKREWEYQSARHTWNPFRIEVPPIGSVLMDPSKKNPRAAVQRLTYQAYDLEDLAKEEMKKDGAGGDGWEMKGRDPYEPIAVTAHWTARWYALMERGGGRLIVRKPNTWGIQPFKHTFGGSADVPAFWNSMDTNPGFRLKETIEQAMLFSVMDTITRSDQADISTLRLLMRAAYAKHGFRGDATEAAAQQRRGILEGEAEDWWIEQVPNMPNQIFTLLEKFNQDIQMGTYNPLQAGFQTGKMDTATEVIVLSGKTEAKWGATVEMLGQIYSMSGSDVLKMLYMLKRDWWSEFPGITLALPKLGNAPLRVTDLGTPPQFHIQATFEHIDAATQMQQERLASEQVAQGLRSRRSWMGVARIQDATGEEAQILEEQALQLPEVLAYRQRTILMERKMGDLVREMEEREAQERMAAMTQADGQTPLFSGNGRQNGST